MFKRRAVKPFHYQQLNKVTRREAELFKGMVRLAPRLGLDEGNRRILVQGLKSLLGDEVTLNLRGMGTTHDTPWSQGSEYEAVYGILGLGPLPHKAIVKLDPALAFVLIDKLLGGAGEPQLDRMHLTGTEPTIFFSLFF